MSEVLGYVPEFNYALSALLGVLVMAHVYWFYLIARIAYRQVITGSASDTREDED